MPATITPPPATPQLDSRLCLRIRREHLDSLERIAAATGTDRCNAARHLLAQALEAVASAT